MALEAELGPRQHGRDNVTRFPGQKIVDFCSITIFAVAAAFRYPGLKIFHIFLVPEAVLNCRVVIVAKLKSCRVPSSGQQNHVSHSLTVC